MKKLWNKVKESKAKIVGTLGVATIGVSNALATNVFASETGSGININFEPTQMFTYSNVIISCLMPVVYITAGLSLGFTVIYALKSAFGSRM